MTINILGKDIRIFNNDLQFSSSQDFKTIEGDNNLQQAIINRLQTIKGEYAIQNYGSKISNCIGKPRNELLKSQLTGYIVETLLQEPRIKSIQNVSVSFNSLDMIQIDVSITITPITETNPLNMIFPLFLE